MSNQLKCPNCKNYHVSNILYNKLRVLFFIILIWSIVIDLIVYSYYSSMSYIDKKFKWFWFFKSDFDKPFSFSNFDQVWIFLFFIPNILVITRELIRLSNILLLYGKTFKCQSCGYIFNR